MHRKLRMRRRTARKCSAVWKGRPGNVHVNGELGYVIGKYQFNSSYRAAIQLGDICTQLKAPPLTRSTYTSTAARAIGHRASTAGAANAPYCIIMIVGLRGGVCSCRNRARASAAVNTLSSTIKGKKKKNGMVRFLVPNRNDASPMQFLNNSPRRSSS